MIKSSGSPIEAACEGEAGRWRESRRCAMRRVVGARNLPPPVPPAALLAPLAARPLLRQEVAG